jgi:hypothetical protein
MSSTFLCRHAKHQASCLGKSMCQQLGTRTSSMEAQDAVLGGGKFAPAPVSSRNFSASSHASAPSVNQTGRGRPHWFGRYLATSAAPPTAAKTINQTGRGRPHWFHDADSLLANNLPFIRAAV